MKSAIRSTDGVGVQRSNSFDLAAYLTAVWRFNTAVEIESIGDQGDGIAKVDCGYVLIVPDTGVGDYVTVEIETAQENVGFATVVDRNPLQP